MRINSYFIGIGWFLLSILSSISNDVIAKYTGSNLPSFEVAFFRFLFSALTLIPIIFYRGIDSIKSSRPFVHFVRGFILFLGITAWTHGLSAKDGDHVVQLTAATLISFTIPMFTLVLACFFLKENIIWQRWVATIVGFIGVALALDVHNIGVSTGAVVLVVSAIGFAGLDIINKKFIIKETMLSMLFYSALVTAILAFVPAMVYWQPPTLFQLFLFLILGASANLILFFILKAYSLVDATAVAPYRYLELLFSSAAGFAIFGEIPTKGILYATIIIIPATLFIVYSENKNKN